MNVDNDKGKLLGVVSILVDILASSESSVEVEERIHDELLGEGISVWEIHEALGLLALVVERFKAVSKFTFRDATDMSSRALTPRESLSMTEEAKNLFEHWKSAGLVTPDEAEEILRWVTTAGTGELDTEDLEKIAHSIVEDTSPLKLYLFDPTKPH